eukprot:TRINITY_DN16508_c1_g1_i2.p3 TRINITY_DN16508_c1_g1~~TRINITY_DN16508_c1_g1_i2.p3  ORF type:complete len:164 (-),score=9.42 TRINITY_DN16508_c1_g1_i2:471-962(-)
MQLKDQEREEQNRRACADACLPRVPFAFTQDRELNFQKQLHTFDYISNISRQADILIVAVGVPGIVKSGWIKPGAIVIDVGINIIFKNDSSMNSVGSFYDTSRQDFKAATKQSRDNYQIVGDVSFEEVLPLVSKISPVPGGVGPMTIAALLHNLLQAVAIRQC